MKDYIRTRYIPKWQKFPWTFKTWLENNWWAIIIALQIVIIGLILFDHRVAAKIEIAAPIPDSQIIKPSPSPDPSPEVKIESYKVTKPETKTSEVKTNWTGTASYYSRAGCVGCKYRNGKEGWNLYMHNGEVLDDTKLTVAFNWLPLNSMIKVTNIDTGNHINAKVADTGGFNRLGRIVDLGLAVKEAIGCNHLCQVKVEKI